MNTSLSAAGDTQPRQSALTAILFPSCRKTTISRDQRRSGDRHAETGHAAGFDLQGALSEGEIVKTTYGFDYHKHFRFMLIRPIGVISVEVVERQVDQAKHLGLKSTLGNLLVVRDSVAHTHLKGVTRTLDAPSVTMGNFQRVYDGLLDLYRTMRRFGW
jgi:hypothetical protein